MTKAAFLIISIVLFFVNFCILKGARKQEGRELQFRSESLDFAGSFNVNYMAHSELWRGMALSR